MDCESQAQIAGQQAVDDVRQDHWQASAASAVVAGALITVYSGGSAAPFAVAGAALGTLAGGLVSDLFTDFDAIRNSAEQTSLAECLKTSDTPALPTAKAPAIQR